MPSKDVLCNLTGVQSWPVQPNLSPYHSRNCIRQQSANCPNLEDASLQVSHWDSRDMSQYGNCRSTVHITYSFACHHSWWLLPEDSIPARSLSLQVHCGPAGGGHILKGKVANDHRYSVHTLHVFILLFWENNLYFKKKNTTRTKCRSFNINFVTKSG